MIIIAGISIFRIFMWKIHIIMLIQDIGQNIKLRRKALKIKQSDLAQLANVSINTLYKIERGQSNPTIDIIERIAVILGLEVKMEVKKL